MQEWPTTQTNGKQRVSLCGAVPNDSLIALPDHAGKEEPSIILKVRVKYSRCQVPILVVDAVDHRNRQCKSANEEMENASGL